MTPEQVFVLCLATWRISNLLVNEHGPLAMFDWLRGLFGIAIDPMTEEKHLLAGSDNEIGKMLLCVWCTSIWVGGLLLLFMLWVPVVPFLFCLWMSMSAIACILDRYNEGA